MTIKHPKKIILVAGARPNFIKIAPIYKEMKKYPDTFQPIFVHTGQHYDNNMSEVFLHDLGLPGADIYLGAGSASHAVQTAKVMVEFEKVLEKEKPDLVIVVGEAGLRSFDRTMPEEINRILTDQISDILFTTCEDVEEIPVIFPAHPRTQKRMEEFGFTNDKYNNGFFITDPVGYFDFLNLEMNTRFVLTDSGGVQEETTFFKVPCITIRKNTERPITVNQ